MKTFNDIVVGDTLFIINSIGITSVIDEIKVTSIEETNENQLLIKSNDFEIIINEEERCHNHSKYSSCYIEAKDVVKALEEKFVASKEWFTCLVEGYNDKLNKFYQEISKWKTRV